MKKTAWAIVTNRGSLVLTGGQCPIYWLRFVAVGECIRQNRAMQATKQKARFYVRKVSINGTEPW